MKLSVIIPIYNMEKYIEKCVDSILDQTYKDYEIILVNDGSVDKSSQIIGRYEKKYKRIKCIHKENGGLSDARNVGVRSANNDYILFIDSDDFINNKYAFEKIVNRLNNTECDVLNFGFEKYYDTQEVSKIYFDKIKENMPNEVYKSNNSFKYLIENSLYIASAWNKVIKRELFLQHNLYFKEGIYSEDIEWCARLALATDSFDFINENFYSYRQRESSISKNMSNKNIKDLKDSIITCCEYAMNLDEPQKEYFLNYVSYQYGTFLVCQGKASCNNEIKLYIDEMESYQYLLKYRINKKIKILYYLKSLIGYKRLCGLIRQFYKLK